MLVAFNQDPNLDLDLNLNPNLDLDLDVESQALHRLSSRARPGNQAVRRDMDCGSEPAMTTVVEAATVVATTTIVEMTTVFHRQKGFDASGWFLLLNE